MCYNTETRIPKFTGHVLRGRGTEGVANMVLAGQVDENWRTDDSNLLGNCHTIDIRHRFSGAFCSVALCNKTSRTIALCNKISCRTKLEMDGRRISKPNNKYHYQQQQQ